MQPKPPPLRLRDLVTEPDGGRLSKTACWSHIIYAAGTVGFIKSAWFGPLSAELLAVYLAAGGGFAAISKYLSNKARNNQYTSSYPPIGGADGYTGRVE